MAKKRRRPFITTLDEREMVIIRTAFAERLGSLSEAEMEDKQALRLVRRLTREAEKAWGVRYQQRF